jgi:hypothetical protein
MKFVFSMDQVFNSFKKINARKTSFFVMVEIAHEESQSSNGDAYGLARVGLVMGKNRIN